MTRRGVCVSASPGTVRASTLSALMSFRAVLRKVSMTEMYRFNDERESAYGWCVSIENLSWVVYISNRVGLRLQNRVGPRWILLRLERDRSGLTRELQCCTTATRKYCGGGTHVEGAPWAKFEASPALIDD